MYFALTSLSTVGFGDYYPITDFERLLCSVLLISGVLIMSYVLSELRFMMSNFLQFNGNIESNDELEDFFLLLTKFNDGNQINNEIQTQIRIFMNYKWSNDKNCFLVTDEDKMMLEQLPDSCKIDLYTNFIFKDFLFKFRRFLSFRIENQFDIINKKN